MLLIDVQERIEQAAKNLGLNPTFTHSGDLAQVLTVHHAGKSIGIKFPRKELEYGETSSAKMIAHKISIAEKFLRSPQRSKQGPPSKHTSVGRGTLLDHSERIFLVWRCNSITPPQFEAIILIAWRHLHSLIAARN